MDDVGEAGPAMGESMDSQAAEEPSRYLVSVVEDVKFVIIVIAILVIVIIMFIRYFIFLLLCAGWWYG
jgi:hypothetical protein